MITTIAIVDMPLNGCIERFKRPGRHKNFSHWIDMSPRHFAVKLSQYANKSGVPLIEMNLGQYHSNGTTGKARPLQIL